MSPANCLRTTVVPPWWLRLAPARRQHLAVRLGFRWHRRIQQPVHCDHSCRLLEVVPPWPQDLPYATAPDMNGRECNWRDASWSGLLRFPETRYAQP
jgi:hypothetical protein